MIMYLHHAFIVYVFQLSRHLRLTHAPMGASSARVAGLVSQLVKNATSITIVTIARTKILTFVAHRVPSRRTHVDGRKQNRTTLTGQDSMVVQQTVELVLMHLVTLQVWWLWWIMVIKVILMVSEAGGDSGDSWCNVGSNGNGECDGGTLDDGGCSGGTNGDDRCNSGTNGDSGCNIGSNGDFMVMVDVMMVGMVMVYVMVVLW